VCVCFLTRVIISHLTRKRHYENTNDFVADSVSRLSGMVQIICNGWTAYVTTSRVHLFGRLNLAVTQKIYDENASEIILLGVDLNYRHSQPKCTGIKLVIVAGTPDIDKICTSHIERLNLSVRALNRCFTRLCFDFSRKLVNHPHSVAWFTVAHNFCKVHSMLGYENDGSLAVALLDKAGEVIKG
jgi:hypothetical protein